MYRTANVTFLILTLLPYFALSQSSHDAYETLYRDGLPIIRSQEFGMLNGPDSEIFEFPLFCLQCEGDDCIHNYVEGISMNGLSISSRLHDQKTLNRQPSNSTINDSLATLGNNSSMVSLSNETQRFVSPWIGRDTRRRAICTDGSIAEQLSYRTGYYRLGCKRLAPYLRADPGDTREKIVTEIHRLSRFATLRQTDTSFQKREAVCDNGYYIWGMACVDSTCDYFNIICIRVLIRRNFHDDEEPMEESDTRVCNSRVCCPLSCESCGGADCADRDGGRRNCCESDIRLFGPVCQGPNDAPCVLSPDDLISTSIDDSHLHHCNGRVCCAESCEQCGGSECSSDDGGADNCCTTKILEAGRVCRGPEDFPCVMT